MASCGLRHKELGPDGQGLCSVPMWMGGLPAGFCNETAYGPPVNPRPERYVPGLACPMHGGPHAPAKTPELAGPAGGGEGHD